MAVTRDEVKATAWNLLRAGQRPTTTNVREQLGGRGSQQTLVAALSEFWGDVGHMLTDSELPSTVLDSARSTWKQAVQVAGELWGQERAALLSAAEKTQASLADNETRHHETVDALQRNEEMLASANGVAEQLRRNLEQATVDLAEQRRLAAAKESEAQALREELCAEREARERDEAGLLNRVDVANQRTKEEEARSQQLAARLEKSSGEIVTLKLDQATKAQALVDLEQRVADWKKQGESLSSKLEAREARIAECEREIGKLASALAGSDKRLTEAKEEAERSRVIGDGHRGALEERNRAIAILETRLEMSERALQDALSRRGHPGDRPATRRKGV